MNQTIALKNNHLMVREIERKEEQRTGVAGLIIPEEILEEEQVSVGEIIESSSEEYTVGDSVMFHKVIPVDIKMKYGGDKELRTYWFVKEADVICVMKNV